MGDGGAIRLVRCDLDVFEDGISKILPLSEPPKDRNDLITQFQLPSDSIVKLSYNGKLIPWSLVPQCSTKLEIQIFRPHQNIKPKHTENFVSDNLIREKVSRLENRISSLEQSMDKTTIDMKTERDMQLLTKQISFLSRRLEEADQAEWIKKT